MQSPSNFSHAGPASTGADPSHPVTKDSLGPDANSSQLTGGTADSLRFNDDNHAETIGTSGKMERSLGHQYNVPPRPDIASWLQHAAPGQHCGGPRRHPIPASKQSGSDPTFIEAVEDAGKDLKSFGVNMGKRAASWVTQLSGRPLSGTGPGLDGEGVSSGEGEPLVGGSGNEELGEGDVETLGQDR